MNVTDRNLPTIPDNETAVRQRYSQGAKQREPVLCCPVSYDTDLLKLVPQEVIDKDYGCGDPSTFVRSGDVVLDLGSGGGKICFVASQITGPQGKVIGVDCNEDMLALARRNQPLFAERVGYDNVQFRNGLIQDLRLNLDLLAQRLKDQPITDTASWLRLRSLEEQLRREQPLIEDDSVDCVLSNCVLNLVRQEDRQQLFAEIYRVLRKNGRAAISDIVSDEEVPDHLRQDPTLWSGCISGAYREDQFLAAFEQAGFHGIRLAKREAQPWQVVEGIEFRSVTVVAYKGKEGPCLERNQALMYRGPFKHVEDDDGHRFYRGQAMAVCDKTYHLLQRDPYVDQFEAIAPREEIPLDRAAEFDCQRSRKRDPRETKGNHYMETKQADKDCCSGDSCC